MKRNTCRKRRGGGVTFKKRRLRKTRMYEIPNSSNLTNGTNARPVTENVENYYSERLPFSNLIPSRGQTVKGETRHMRNARAYFAAQGMPQEEINARMQHHKYRVNRLAELQKHLSNVYNAKIITTNNNKINNVKYSTLNVPTTLNSSSAYLHPNTAPALANYSSENIEIGKTLMQRRANDEFAASLFGSLYKDLPIENDNTNNTIRHRFLNLIDDGPDDYKNYLRRRIYQYHPMSDSRMER